MKLQLYINAGPFRRLLINLSAFLLVFVASCQEEPKEQPDFSSMISVETQAATGISFRSATLHGTLKMPGTRQSVSDYGHCWGTDAEPAVDGLHSSKGSTNKESLTFESNIADLEPSTTYNFRAYFIKSEVVVYGETGSFSTIQTSAPSLSTAPVTSITTTSAACGGTISDDGGFPVTSRGIVWSTSSGPTVESNEGITIDELDSEIFHTINKANMSSCS